MVVEVDNLGLAVSDLDQSIRFYCEILGFELTDRDAQTRTAAIQAGAISLYLFESPVPEPPDRSSYPANNPPGIDHVSFRVNDVDDTYSTLVSRSVEFFLPPEDADWGARICGCKDPSGILLYFLKWRT
jgi:methylmalonyl-CoA/ethylmalonyl-CoA epimerase